MSKNTKGILKGLFATAITIVVILSIALLIKILVGIFGKVVFAFILAGIPAIFVGFYVWVRETQ